MATDGGSSNWGMSDLGEDGVVAGGFVVGGVDVGPTTGFAFELGPGLGRCAIVNWTAANRTTALASVSFVKPDMETPFSKSLVEVVVAGDWLEVVQK